MIAVEVRHFGSTTLWTHHQQLLLQRWALSINNLSYSDRGNGLLAWSELRNEPLLIRRVTQVMNNNMGLDGAGWMAFADMHNLKSEEKFIPLSRTLCEYLS